jgi:hypothetical protein
VWHGTYQFFTVGSGVEKLLGGDTHADVRVTVVFKN